MSVYVLPVLYALFVWWFSTGAILYLDGLPRRTFRWSMLGASVLVVFALYALVVSSTDTSVSGAYIAFTAALVIWGWQEMSFLMGFVTGSRQAPSPPGSSALVRFGHAVQSILYHELAILASAVLVVALTWGGDNQVGTWTFMVLWLMRVSAKLNVYWGVPNLNEDFLPEHLRYLRHFLNRKPMNSFFPLSVTAATIVASLLVLEASADEASLFEATAFTFAATLTWLAILEHWFLVLPLPDAALWNWALRSRETTEDTAASHDNAMSAFPPRPATSTATGSV